MKKWLKLTSFAILITSLGLSTSACTTKEKITDGTSNQGKDPHSNNRDDMGKDGCYYCSEQARNYKVYENEYVYAFLKENPATNGHTVVVPKKHFKTLADCDAIYLAEIWKACKIIAQKIYSSFKSIGTNYLSKDGKSTDQTISYFYQEVIPKYVDGEGYMRNVNVSAETWKCDLKQVAKMISKDLES